jgi:hypothetical protein
MFELCCLNLSNITLHWSLIVKLFNKWSFWLFRKITSKI